MHLMFGGKRCWHRGCSTLVSVMSINPLTALAVPVGAITANRIVQRLTDQRPFQHFFTSRGEEANRERPETAIQTLDEFGTAVAARLKAAGIETSLRFQLSTDPTGQLRVVGDHPRKERIEAALAGDAELSIAFGQLANAHDLVHAAGSRSAPFTLVINGSDVTLAT